VFQSLTRSNECTMQFDSGSWRTNRLNISSALPAALSARTRRRTECGSGWQARAIRQFRLRDCRVVRFGPSRVAAPFAPATGPTDERHGDSLQAIEPATPAATGANRMPRERRLEWQVPKQAAL